MFSVFSLHSWDEGFIGLTVPARADTPLMIDIDISHKFGTVFPPSGIDARVELGVDFLSHFRLSGEYTSDLHSGMVRGSAWLPFSIFVAGVAYSLVIGTEPLTGSVYVSQAADLYITATLLSDHFTAALDLQFDSYLRRMNAGLGLSVRILPDLLSIVGEGYLSPPFTSDETLSLGWNAGVLLKTYGHQFLLFVGSGTNLKMREILAFPENNQFSFGFILRRKFDFYFNS